MEYLGKGEGVDRCLSGAVAGFGRGGRGNGRGDGMIARIAVILACQLAGEVVARSFGLPVPGPVLGMAVMLGVL